MPFVGSHVHFCDSEHGYVNNVTLAHLTTSQYPQHYSIKEDKCVCNVTSSGLVLLVTYVRFFLDAQNEANMYDSCGPRLLFSGTVGAFEFQYFNLISQSLL